MNKKNEESIIQINYHIVPFAYNKKYKSVVDCIDEEIWQCKEAYKDKTFQHIDKLICKENDRAAIGRAYELKNETGRIHYNLPGKLNMEYVFKNKGEEQFKFIIEGIELYLFETQVGFIVMKYKYLDSDIEDIINNNYWIKKYKIESASVEYSVKTSKTDIEKKELKLLDIIFNITDDFEITTYFENDKYPVSSFIYNAAIIKKPMEQEELLRYLFMMRRSFKNSYKPASLEYDLKDNEEILQIFENSYWGVALEAVANIAYFVNDETTNSFLEDTYMHRLKNDYFYIIMLLLHQRYALLHYSILASQIQPSIRDNIANKREEGKTDRESITPSSLKEKMSFYTLRSSYRIVSNITHQNKLYTTIRKALQIEEMMDELNYELDALSSIIQLEEKSIKDKAREEELRAREKEDKIKQAEREYKEKEKELNDKKNDFKEKYFFLFSTVFVLLSATATAWGLIINVEQGLIPTTPMLRAVFGGSIIFIWVGSISALVTAFIKFYIWKKQEGK